MSSRIAKLAQLSQFSSVIALSAGLAFVAGFAPMPGFDSVASAQQAGQGNQGQQQGYQGGGEGGHDGGHETGGHDGEDEEGHEGGHSDGGGTHGNAPAGAGAGGDDGTGHGGQGNAGGAQGTGNGGPPTWADEGIPEDLELGRLNVARSPNPVILRALAEAEATLSADMADFYNMSLEDILEELELRWDDVVMVDSPLQNLAMLRELLSGGTIDPDALGVTIDQTGDDLLKLAAVFLGTASDKDGEISEDTVRAVITVLNNGLPGSATPITLSDADIAKLAADAEAVRDAIETGHG